MSQQPKSENLTPGTRLITRKSREYRHKHRGGVLWFTGLSGSGKSTLAAGLEQRLFDAQWQVAILDGDSMRQGLNDDLGFSAEDRTENLRRAAEVARLMADSGLLVIASFITPTEHDRSVVYRILQDDYALVYLNADLRICERRDPKGLYVKARAGVIREFSGISAPYEPPFSPDLTVNTYADSVSECVAALALFATRNYCR